jgi:hypothetical protein
MSVERTNRRSITDRMFIRSELQILFKEANGSEPLFHVHIWDVIFFFGNIMCHFRIAHLFT